MDTDQITYKSYRYPPEIISQAVWLYHRFCLSYRDVEDLLAERGITVSYETVRQWCGKFGPSYARAVKRMQGVLGDTWFLDEVLSRFRADASICGELWIRMAILSTSLFRSGETDKQLSVSSVSC